MKKIYSLLFALCIFSLAQAQFSKYIIKLKFKAPTSFSLNTPGDFLSAKAIARRIRYNIALDSTDLPIPVAYINAIKNTGAVTIINTSKWLNQVAIQTTDAAALAAINSLPFVVKTHALAPRQSTGATKNKFALEENFTPITQAFNGESLSSAAAYSYGAATNQVSIHNGQFLHDRGYNGNNMHMAIMDAGFLNYLTLKTFDSLRTNSQIRETWDFVAGNTSVNEDNAHGMQCLSSIGANLPGSFVGTAPKTNFYLYRTEDVAIEYPIEEQNWIAAAERADSIGIDVFSTSLGYFDFDGTFFDYTYAAMTGDSSMIARANDLAAKKGILSFVAAGNEGGTAWNFIITPADADSVVAVGAVNNSGVPASFSSFGPSADGQVKPTLAAVGAGAVIANPSTGNPGFGNGTSFACPNLAGLGTCLWSAFPEYNNMAIIDAMRRSGSKFNNPDTRVGFGIPNMKNAFCQLLRPSFSSNINVGNCKATINLGYKTDTGIVLHVERKIAAGSYQNVNSFGTTGAFANRNFSFVDDLSNITGTSVTYRIRAQVSDTSFYLDSTNITLATKANLGADKTVKICPASFNLNNQYNSTGFSSAWYFGNTPVNNPTAVNTEGTYQFIANNTNGCADTALLSLSYWPKPSLGLDKADVFCSNKSYNATTMFNTTGLNTQWTLNGNNIARPDSLTLPGTYQLIVTSSNSCTDTALLNLNHFPEPCYFPVQEKIQVQPNPFSQNLSVMVARNQDFKVSITVYAANGKLVQQRVSQQVKGAQLISLNLGNQAAGIYLVRIQVNNEAIITKKVLKK